MLSRYKPRTVVGIDWSDKFLKLVCLNKSAKGYALVVADRYELDAGVVEHGKIIDYAVMAESLLILLKRAGIKNRHAAFALSSVNTIIKVITVDDTIKPEHLYEQILLDIEQHIAYNPDDAYVDYQLLGPSKTPNKNDVFFIATHKEHVAQYFKLSNMCKLIPDILDVDSYVWQRFLMQLYLPLDKQIEDQSCYAMICLNYKRFKVHFINQQAILFNEQKNLATTVGESEHIAVLSTWLERHLQLFSASNTGG